MIDHIHEQLGCYICVI
ncbi:putative membrane protein, partial [Chlamydia psittaci 84-8471/1]